MAGFIELKHVKFAYPHRGHASIPALHDLSLSIEEGSYTALVGANGSGKSTLARMLNGLLIPDEGTVEVARLVTHESRHHQEIRRRVGMVFQHPEDQVVAATVADDVAFGPENIGLPPEIIKERTEQALKGAGIWAERDRPPHLLSAGQIQRVALAGVLAMKPSCIVFDEATAMLDPGGRSTVRRLMKQLHRDGLTVIHITHDMDEALDAERIVALDHGQVAMDGTPREVFSDRERLERLGLDAPPVVALATDLRQLIPGLPEHLYTLDELSEALRTVAPVRGDVLPASAARQASDPVIEVENLEYTYLPGTPLAQRALQDVDLTIWKERAQGLLGSTGSGKSTLLQHLNGLLRPQRGAVRVEGVDLADPRSDIRAIRRRVGLVFQIPESQIFEQYVGDEIAFGPRLMGVSGPDLRERVQWAMEQVGLPFEVFKDRYTFALSGGEKRKVALASVLALRPATLLLDEPTAGLDPMSHRDVLHNIQNLRGAGMALVLSSHQMEDLALLAQDLTVLDLGSVILDGSAAEVFRHGDLLRSLGLDTPLAVQIAEHLRGCGWLVPESTVTGDQLVAWLRAAG